MNKRQLFNISRLVDETTKEVPIETSFVEDFNYCICNINKSNSLPSPTYKPSGFNCIRKMYYERVETPLDEQNTSPELIAIGETGTDRHLRIQNVVSKMKSCGIDCEYVDVEDYVNTHDLPDLKIIGKSEFETKLHNTKYNLNFLCDGIIKYKGTYYILEIKTESSYKWREQTGIMPEHLNQATLYSMCFNIPQVLFLYESRDFLSKKCYITTITQEQIQNVINTINQCEECVKVHIPPNKPENITNKICQYCGYRKTCRKDR